MVAKQWHGQAIVLEKGRATTFPGSALPGQPLPFSTHQCATATITAAPPTPWNQKGREGWSRRGGTVERSE